MGRRGDVFCDPTPSPLATVGPPLLPAKPTPYVAPLDPQQREILLVGAYAVWLPRSGPGRNGMDLSDITTVVAHDAAGNVVAQLT
ncbi:hypothetical protein HC028_14280 [Planosporangium flavigriseum]|nr:hypothetical protein [Planosporangium flavigriseum]NJC65656.1 hypothetical protein [Planosporangium flavigriseum]